MIINRFLLALALLVAVPGSPQQISFFAEDLKFEIKSESFEVDGLYYFRNNTTEEIRQMLLYPFPETSQYGPITHVEIHKEGDTISMLVTQTEKGCLFKLQIPPTGEVVYRIGYGQSIKGSQAKYIITTTQAWEVPFESAKYQLKFPASFQTLKSSLPPDSIATGSEKVIYFWERENFMPVRDFEFEFKTRQSH